MVGLKRRLIRRDFRCRGSSVIWRDTEPAGRRHHRCFNLRQNRTTFLARKVWRQSQGAMERLRVVFYGYIEIYPISLMSVEWPFNTHSSRVNGCICGIAYMHEHDGPFLPLNQDTTLKLKCLKQLIGNPRLSFLLAA